MKVDGSVDLFVGRGVGDEIGRVFGDELALGMVMKLVNKFNL